MHEHVHGFALAGFGCTLGDRMSVVDQGMMLLGEGEAALDRGESEIAFDALERATRCGVPRAQLQRLATAFARAARYLSRQQVVHDWIEQRLDEVRDGAERCTLLAARIAVCRQFDVPRVLRLAEEALAAADAAGDEQAYASVLANASFAAYRAGDGRVATQYAQRAAARQFTTDDTRYDASRAQMFAATACGELERALALAKQSRDLAITRGRDADAANESNNIAEGLIDLGRPAEARDAAARAAELARAAGHRSVETFARVLISLATAEIGEIDRALELLAAVESLADNRIFAVDAAAAEAFWLLERGASGDVPRARRVAEQAIAIADRTGVSNRLTALWSHVARSLAREGRAEDARAALEHARRAMDRSDPHSEGLLALAFAEALPVDDPQRRVALSTARTRILRSAGRRDDPGAYCRNVRLHRRLLELSGGIPGDLPG